MHKLAPWIVGTAGILASFSVHAKPAIKADYLTKQNQLSVQQVSDYEVEARKASAEAAEKAERQRQEQMEFERLRALQMERERIIRERLEAEQRERERIEAERREYLRLEAERLRLERERIENERLAREQRERERIERQRLEKEQQAREKEERERLKREQIEREKEERERLRREQLERQAAEREELRREQAERQAAERERLRQEQEARQAAERAQLEAKQKAAKLPALPVAPLEPEVSLPKSEPTLPTPEASQDSSALEPKSEAAPVAPVIIAPEMPKTEVPADKKALPADNFRRVALLLPTRSAHLGAAAKMVRAGVEAAAKLDGATVSMYETDGKNTLAQYQKAVKEGAQLIIGPLSRPEIAQIASKITVPTLALNSLEGAALKAEKLYSLNLSVEDEAKQVARVMIFDERKQPLVLSDGSALAKRMSAAFAKEWQERQHYKVPIVANVKHYKASFDSVFLAIDAEKNGKLAQTLKSETPKYGSSVVYANQKLAQSLKGLILLDMPWFMRSQDEPSTQYAQPSQAKSMLDQRMYALGIDAWRLSQPLANQKIVIDEEIDGVTGKLSLRGHQRTFWRRLPVTPMEPKK